MPHEQLTISTRDGACPAYVFTPRDERGEPAAIFYMDAGGIRPAAQRLADAGYVEPDAIKTANVSEGR